MKGTISVAIGLAVIAIVSVAAFVSANYPGASDATGNRTDGYNGYGYGMMGNSGFWGGGHCHDYDDNPWYDGYYQENYERYYSQNVTR